MQPESSKDPGGTSIQKLKEACELVTITKQRRHIFLNETKRTLKRGYTSSKVRLSGLRPEPFQLHWPHCFRFRSTKPLLFVGCRFISVKRVLRKIGFCQRGSFQKN